jgi:hypothetical protein
MMLLRMEHMPLSKTRTEEALPIFVTIQMPLLRRGI